MLTILIISVIYCATAGFFALAFCIAGSDADDLSEALYDKLRSRADVDGASEFHEEGASL